MKIIDKKIDINSIIKGFQDTRKHKRYNRIVADSFISKYNDEYTLVNMKNSKIVLRVSISKYEAKSIIKSLGLVYESSSFNNAGTYRTKIGWSVVRDLLNINRD